MSSSADTEPPPSLLTLPADVSLHVLAYLSLNDLYHLRMTSKRCHQFFEAHEEPIYHQAAIYHHFVQPQTSLEEAAHAHESWLGKVHHWKELCRRWLILERNWDGRGFVREGGLPPHDGSVIDFVIDEDQRTAISLSRRGGLTVRALEDGKLLWALSDQYVATTRCDFSNGFLVFMAKHSGIEIWRRTADVHTTTLRRYGEVVHTPVVAPAPGAVRDFQVQAGVYAPMQTDSDRGHFVPHAYVDTSQDIGPIRLFRVHYPLLAYVGFNALHDVAVVDITSGDVVWRVSAGQGRILGMPSHFTIAPAEGRIIMDIDLTHKYLAVCLHSAVVVYRIPASLTSEEATKLSTADSDAGEKPPDMLVLGDIDTPAARQTTAHLLMLAAGDRTEPNPVAIHGIPLPVWATPRGQDVLEKYDIVPPPLSAQHANMHALVPAGLPRSQPGFVRVRFSPDGKHLVAATAFGLLYFAWEFARVERGLQFSEITEYLLIDESLRDISWNSDPRRLAVRTARDDVFIITINSSFHGPRFPSSAGPNSSTTPSPRLTLTQDATVHRLLDFSNRKLVGRHRGQGAPSYGMQMTRTALWLVWNFALLSHAVTRHRARTNGERSFEPAPEDDDNFRGTVSGVGSVCFLEFTPGW